MSKQTFTWQTSQVEQIAMQLYVFHVPTQLYVFLQKANQQHNIQVANRQYSVLGEGRIFK